VPDQDCSRGSDGGPGSLQYLASPTLPLAKTILLINKIWDRAVIQRRGSILSWSVILSVYGADTIAIDLSLSALIS
jgi:hypothetical protein